VNLPLITSPILASVSGLKHGFSTRDGGVSEGSFASLNLGRESGDIDESVDQNYERLANAFGTTKESLVGSHQVHGANVICVRGQSAKDDYWGTDADALITNETGKFLTVRVADCLPVLIADEAHHAIAAVHVGWRGTLAQTLPAALTEMQKEFKTDPQQVRIAIGPGIGICCYEVAFGISALMRQEFDLVPNEFREKESAVLLDLARINTRLAVQCGARADQIWVSGACTRCDDKRFFSYRRDGKQSGRLAGVIGWSA
jgi:polyphenol oxidase